jgi:diguanylate cyclase (GGDEF)-like protein
MDRFISAVSRTFHGERKINDRRKYQASGAILAFIHLFFVWLFHEVDVSFLLVYNIIIVLFYSVITIITGVVYRYTHIFIATFVEVLLHSSLASFLLGWDWGFMTYTLGLVPLSFYIAYTVPHFNRKIKIPIIASAIVFIIYIITRQYCVHSGAILHPRVSSEFINRVFLFNIMLTFCFLWAVALLFSLEVYYMQNHLQSENTSLEQLANYDPLTKLMNRRSMDIYLRDAVENAAKKDEEFCLIMADIDDFKQVNDTYGHAAGDEVLKEVAKIIAGNVREEDCVCRWGGEEILILVRAGLDVAESVADRICKDIAAARIEAEGVKLAVTMTLGVAGYVRGDTVDSITERADKNLYTGKRHGKNQVVK